VRRLIAIIVFRLWGWRPEGGPPEDASRYVIVAAPHTSNWDFPLLIGFAWMYRVRIAWVGKQSLFRWPFGPFMRRLGGVAVRRDHPEGLVSQLAESLKNGPPRGLVIPAEGSRAWRENWKSGFYHVAREAGLPVVLSFLDYKRRVGGFGLAFTPTGNIPLDMDAVREFYSDKIARYPENFGPIRLAEEIVPAES
jgi:1-acyl-sn-glycerol-3-phosphate acyltransferase